MIGQGYNIQTNWFLQPTQTMVRFLSVPTFHNKEMAEYSLFLDFWVGLIVFEIIDIDNDDTVYDTQVADIHGAGFGSTQGLVYIDDVEQSINSWTDTVINITVDQGALSLGSTTLKVFKPV